MAEKRKAEVASKIQRVDIRKVWENEAKDFTPWLENNIDVLSDALDTISLVSAESEGAAGSFSVDLIAEDDDGNAVIIENQLEKSNHEHLGKLITYLTSVEAKTAIWITPDPRPEHIKAVSWLNESYAASFYLFKVEAIRIDDSQPAPLLTQIVGPSEESRQAGKTKKELGERHTLREKFWTGLLEAAKKETKLHAKISPTAYNWVGTSVGVKGLAYNYTVRKHDARVELYIDRGKGFTDWNRGTFERLQKSRQSIEKAFGGTLDWQELEGKQACRITKEIATGGYRDDESEWPDIYRDMIGNMINFEKAFRPHIKKLKSESSK